ncbi:hypothetical protein [Streptomyces sp. NPDC004250]|uniref:hypothetical protein n=1 Tax=Streptomyces sp. NPDC004250 TaxID=3364692 RepID=UPI0036BD207B
MPRPPAAYSSRELQHDRLRGALANSIAPGVGTGTGALLSGALVQYAPAPAQLVLLLVTTGC